jgi:hypothetical protein
MLEFVMRPRTPGGEEKTLVFTSFFGSSRDEAYELCLQLRARHRRASDDAAGSAAMASAASRPLSASVPAAVAAAAAAAAAALQRPTTGAFGAESPSRRSAESSAALALRRALGDEPASMDGAEGERFVDAADGRLYKALSDRSVVPEGQARQGALRSRQDSGRGNSSTLAPSLTAASAPAPSGSESASAEGDDGYDDGVGEDGDERGRDDEGDAEAVAAETLSNDSPLPNGAALATDDYGLGLGPSHAFPSASLALWERLSKSQVVCDTVLPLSVAGFHASFLADDATLSLSDFQKNRGNADAKLTSWVLSRGAASSFSLDRERSTSDHVRRGTASFSFDGDGGGLQSPSSYSGDGPSGDTSEFNQPFLSRTLRMTMPVDGGPFVAKHTAVEVVQRLLAYSWPDDGGVAEAAGAGSMLVLDQSAQSFDVPFGDSFLTEETWLVLPASPNAGPLPLQGHETLPASATAESSTAPADAPMCRFLSLVSVNFSKSVWLKDVIVSKTVSATRESTAAFAVAAKVHAAQQHLQMQLRAGQQEPPRRRRQQQSAQETRQPERSPPLPLGPSSAAALGRSTFARESAPGGAGGPCVSQPSPPQAPDLESKLRPQKTSLAEDAPFSPSLEAALRLPRLPRDALMETLRSPQSLSASPRDDLVRAYTQLYAAHAAAISQVRMLQAELAALRAGGAGANASTASKRSSAEADPPHPLLSAVGPGGSPLHQLGVLIALLLAATAAAVLFAACGGTTLASCPHLLASPHLHHRPAPASAPDEDLANRVVERVLATLAAAAAAAVARNEGPGPGLGAAAGAAGGAGTGAGARGLQ